jgi:hypothetical protein
MSMRFTRIVTAHCTNVGTRLIALLELSQARKLQRCDKQTARRRMEAVMRRLPTWLDSGLFAFAVHAHAALITIDPNNFALGTDTSNACSRARLSGNWSCATAYAPVAKIRARRLALWPRKEE